MANESSNRTFAAVIIDPGTQKLITQEGSLTIGDNTIEYYKKSTAVRMAFGLIGSMIEGRGKLLFSLQDEDISGYNYIEYRKKQMPTIYLKSGTAYTISFAKPDQACPVLDAYMRQLFSRRESREMGNRTARVEQRTARVEQNTFRAEPKTAGAENPAALRRAEEIYHQGERYYDGTKEIPKNPQKALECFLEAGRMGYSDGLFMAGIMLLNGDGVMPDEKRASNLLYAAAAKKNKFALKQIGFMYRNGKGVPQDYHKAMLYYREAVNAGLVDAWNNIGFLYRTVMASVRTTGQRWTAIRKRPLPGIPLLTTISVICIIWALGFRWIMERPWNTIARVRMRAELRAWRTLESCTGQAAG